MLSDSEEELFSRFCERTINQILDLSPEERMKFLSLVKDKICWHCGYNQPKDYPRCQCNYDD
jgi:hypothetical protein